MLWLSTPPPPSLHLFPCSLSAKYDDYDPEIGHIGKHPDSGDSDHDKDLGHDTDPYEGDEDPEHGADHKDPGHDEGEKDPEVGPDGYIDPPHIVANALLCLNEKHIYSNCEESYRLSGSGELHIPHDHVNEFCSGPCLEETNHVLHCIEGIMDHFVFYNKATTQDVRDTILAGCGHGDERGDFDVAEHIEADGGGEFIGCKGAIPVVFGIVITIIGHILLF